MPSVVLAPRLRRHLAWLTPLGVTLLAAALRFWNLAHPHAIVFDETYYVKEGWTQWVLGYPAKWPDDANERFAAGETDIFLDKPAFIVHPPLGKFFIGAGMALFGADSSFGWRVAVAVFGTATVLVLYFLARTVSGSTAVATAAAGMLAIDGLGIVMSRVALLDGILTFFVVLAVWFVALDRAGHASRLAAAVVWPDDGRPLMWGPVLWNRPWLLAAGAAAGAATGVKWSGVWTLAGLGLYVVVSDALTRRRLGIWLWPTDAAFRQGVVSFLLMVPAAAVVYVTTWTGWFLTDGGYNRQSRDTALASFVHNHLAMYGSASSITSAHSYASPAWQWPLLMRPTSMWAHSTENGVDGCAGGERGCLEILYSMPNPLLWYAAVAASVWLLARVLIHGEGRYAPVLVAIGSGWLPWLIYAERTVFQFYTIVVWPFMLIALAVAMRALATHPDPHRRRTGRRLVVVFAVVAVLLAVAWYPLWSAMQVPFWFYRLHNWLPGWV
ncbi:dolichyl-phosphate-mannose--protein mannosyltransferase [Microbacterium sp. No. 7]|uniref:dolichyl-phosphate-mannose--protein mannosyltransferase n=1 Tax=Microbacterium sp. No. 7 TaxID=1714373 RepID=UPI0006CF54C4|nr:phospholipid carrier-dependent glycosyltransferase [Microbacterium sp. No. 7]ALJ19746.1 dolichyl-phosphate-mannose-protein mannosyltransferase [Microbacterium sp. No. 7]